MFKLVLELETLEYSGNSCYLGNIYIKDETFSFPGERWSDFPVTLVGWWLNEVITKAGTKKDLECLFMDGPYFFKVKRRSKDKWKVFLYRDESHPYDKKLDKKILFHMIEVDSKHFLNELINVSQLLYEACKEKCYPEKDYIHLKERNEKIKAIYNI